MSEYNELLMEGARYGDDEDVSAALEGGASPNYADSTGKTALHMAAANGHTATARLLLLHHANVEAVNAEGSTPLHWAAVNGKKEMVEILMDHGANPAAVNRHEKTPVDEALLHGHQDLLLPVINAAMVARATSAMSVGEGVEGEGGEEEMEEDEEIEEIIMEAQK